MWMSCASWIRAIRMARLGKLPLLLPIACINDLTGMPLRTAGEVHRQPAHMFEFSQLHLILHAQAQSPRQTQQHFSTAPAV